MILPAWSSCYSQSIQAKKAKKPKAKKIVKKKPKKANKAAKKPAAKKPAAKNVAAKSKLLSTKSQAVVAAAISSSVVDAVNPAPAVITTHAIHDVHAVHAVHDPVIHAPAYAAPIVQTAPTVDGAVRRAYRYIDTNRVVQTVEYTANATGFRVADTNLPDAVQDTPEVAASAAPSRC